MFSGTDLYRSSLIYSRSHTAGCKTLPDQLIQTEKISWKRLLYHNRCQCNVSRTDGFMCILDLSCILCRSFSCCCVIFAIMFFHKRTCCCICLICYTGRICTQIGDQTDGSMTLYLNTFIQLLGNTHGLLGREV
ncbi:unknown [Clostridium sp. CAG:7]|nr:unknown [Clostridium sp. CAG:7]